MSFNTALSGLQAATVDLSVTSNNIANVSTTGFKHSRAEFGDIFAVSPFGNAPSAVGSGVQVSRVSQQFEQGNLDFTDGSLDLAINGQGFFIVDQLQSGGAPSYTRAGQFGVNADGFITNSNGQFLQAFPTDAQGNVTTTALNSSVPIQLPASTGAPQATTEVELGFNLDATEPALDPEAFDPTASDTFSHSTSTTVFDSLGSSHVMTYYFVHDAPGSTTNAANDANQWAVFTYLDGVETAMDGGVVIPHLNSGAAVNQAAGIVNFNADGSYANATPPLLENVAVPLGNGALDLNLIHDFANNTTTQYSAPFGTFTLNPDGFATGRLTGLDISEDGILRATFNNGVSSAIGQIAIADFPNPQGLSSIGDASWTETTASGSVIGGTAGTGRFGFIQSGALESSSVDLTAELVNLITAQRNFQANAKSIETSNAITDTIIQIR